MVLEVSNNLEVLVDVGELGRELLVLELAAFLLEDLGHGGDQQQLLLGVGVGEVVGLAGGQLHGGARGLLASQVPGNQAMLHRGSLFLLSSVTHMAETRRSAWRAAFASTLRSSATSVAEQPATLGREQGARLLLCEEPEREVDNGGGDDVE